MAFESHKQRALIKAFIKKLPVVRNLRSLRTRGSNQSRYCYSIWLRHLIHLNRKEKFLPKKLAELGPGDSIGVGLAALLSGTEVIYAFDVNNTIDVPQNLAIFDELVELFKKKITIPDNSEFPYVSPVIEDYGFPSQIINDSILIEALNESRLQAIRSEISQLSSENFNGKYIKYRAPWENNEFLEIDSIDLILSQAVMEHVLKLEDTYKSIYNWLVKGGKMSHQIDFTSHGTSTSWNGHWLYSGWEWQFVNDVEGPAINRATFKNHLDIIKKVGFTIEKQILSKNLDGLKYVYLKNKLPNSEISQDEFSTQGMFIIAKK